MHTMKTADGLKRVETKNENNDKEIIQISPESPFGGSECREKKAKKALKLILKGVPEPDHIPDAGVGERGVDERIYRGKFQNKSQQLS